jgi:hypothetical protein
MRLHVRNIVTAESLLDRVEVWQRAGGAARAPFGRGLYLRRRLSLARRATSLNASLNDSLRGDRPDLLGESAKPVAALCRVLVLAV